MDFVSFIKNVSRDLHDRCGRTSVQRLGRSLDRSENGLTTLLTNNDSILDGFEVETLARLSDAFREYVEWKDAAKNLRRTLAQKGLSLPDGSFFFAHVPHELKALERIAEICQRSGHVDHDAWAKAVEAHVDLWRAAVGLCINEGFASVKLVDPDHPDAEEFESKVASKLALSEIRSYNWLAIRRGERAGILGLSFELPYAEIQAQAEARLSLLGLTAIKRGADAVLKDLIAEELLETVLSVLTRRAESETLSSIRSVYLGLLDTPPLQAERVLSLYVDTEGEAVGMAVLDRKGDILEHGVIPESTVYQQEISALLQKHSIEVAVLPVSGQNPNLPEIEKLLESVPVQRIHDMALSEARKNLSMKRFEASAVVLARRALKPGREWGRVDPLKLSLGEYPRDMEESHLREVLTEARALSSWDRRNRNKTKRKSKSLIQSKATIMRGKRLNTFLKTIRDLRAGMTVDGVVTNLTRFGAFVNIGLPTEGMIHVSQLSDEFVEDPAQVVRIGDQVRARVLEVVPKKQRIALSLKPAAEEGTRSAVSSRGHQKSDRATPKTRSAALADLDALFKK